MTIDIFQTLGAATEQIAFSELYVAPQQGVTASSRGLSSGSVSASSMIWSESPRVSGSRRDRAGSTDRRAPPDRCRGSGRTTIDKSRPRMPSLSRVPLRWLTADEGRPALLRSGSEAEDLVDESALGRHVDRRYGTHLSLGQHRHSLDAGEGSPSGPEVLKAEHRPCSALDPAVVLLDQVVEPLPTPVPGKAP